MAVKSFQVNLNQRGANDIDHGQPVSRLSKVGTQAKTVAELLEFNLISKSTSTPATLFRRIFTTFASSGRPITRFLAGGPSPFPASAP
jgi:hypothetical protein